MFLHGWVSTCIWHASGETKSNLDGCWECQTTGFLAARVNRVQTAAITVIFCGEKGYQKAGTDLLQKENNGKGTSWKKVFSRGKEWSGKFQAVLLFIPINFLLLFHLWVIFLFYTHFAVSDSLKPISLFCCAKHQGCMASWLSSWSSYHNIEIQAFSLSLA